MAGTLNKTIELKDKVLELDRTKQTATITDIAKALNLTCRAIRKRKSEGNWQPMNGNGVARFDIKTITLKPGERKKVDQYLRMKNDAKATAKAVAALKENAGTFPYPRDHSHTPAELQAQRLSARSQSLATFDRLPKRQQKKAQAKLAAIQAFEKFRDDTGLAKSRAMEVFCYEFNMGRIDLGKSVKTVLQQISSRSLLRWITDEHELGAMGLVDLYGNRKGMSKIDSYMTGEDSDGNPVKPYVKAMLAIMVLEPHVEPKKAHEYILATCPNGPELSVKSVARWMAAWKKAHPQKWAWIVNPDKAKGSFQIAFGDAAEGITGPNQRWEIDATPADLLLIDGRHKIIGIIDVGTRRLKLQVSRTEQAADCLVVVRRALLDWGVPVDGELRCDNGKAFVAEHFQRCMRDLEINIHYCRPFSGEEKPFIERAFHTFSHDQVEHLPGYCGHNVAEREAIRSRESFATRLMKKGEVIEMKMTAAELQIFCDRWCATYHDQVHSSLGKSPNQALSEWPHHIHRINDERALDVLLAPAAGRDGWRTITKKGIKIDSFEYIHSGFAPHVGKQVRCLTTEDVGRVVCQLENKQGVLEHLCIAECPEITGISRAEVTAKAQALQKEVKADVAALKRKARKEMAGRSTAEVILACREEKSAASNISHFPRPSAEHSTPALVAAAEAGRALEGKRGREIQHPPEIIEARKRLAQEMSGEAPVTQPRPKVVSFEDKSERQRYRHWKEMKERLKRGETIPEEDYRRLVIYEQSAECQTWASMEKNLGKVYHE